MDAGLLHVGYTLLHRWYAKAYTHSIWLSPRVGLHTTDLHGIGVGPIHVQNTAQKSTKYDEKIPAIWSV